MLARFIRVGAVSAVGLVLDIAIALLLRKGLGLPLPLASAISFLTIAVVNYAMFEFWVFRAGDAAPAFDLARLAKTLATSILALGVRVSLVALAAVALGPARPWFLDAAILVAASGVSLLVNFFVLQRVAFRGR